MSVVTRHRATTVPPGAAQEVRRRRSRVDTALFVWGLLSMLFLFLPVLVVVAYSFNEGRSMLVWEQFGFGSYLDAVTNPALTRPVRVSLLAALGTAVVSTVLGTLAGLALARRPGRWSPAFTLLLGLVMVTPEIVSAVSLLPWFVGLGTEVGLPVFNLGQVRLVVAHSLFATAVVTFIVRARMKGVDASLEEAAADLYAPPARRFWQITFPLMRPAVVSGALLSFTLSLDNTVISSFVSVSGASPWPVYVFSAVRSGLRPSVAAMSTLMLLLTLLALLLVAVVLKRSGDGSTQVARTLAGG